jgi:hypothetical protein
MTNIQVKIEGVNVVGTPGELANLIQSLSTKAETAVVLDEALPKPKRKYVKKTYAVKKTGTTYVKRRRKVAHKKWLPEEDTFVAENYGQIKTRSIAAKLGRSVKAVVARANGTLGVRIHKRRNANVTLTQKRPRDTTKTAATAKNFKKWSPMEDAYLKANWHDGHNVPMLMTNLQRSQKAIEMRAWAKGLRVNNNGNN